MSDTEDIVTAPESVEGLQGKFQAHLTLCTKERGLKSCEEFCRAHRVKLTVIDLESSSGQTQTDVMTTSHYRDEEAGAVARILRQLSMLAKKATSAGISVQRIKLEHESLPSLPQFDAEHYHEVHIKLKIAKHTFTPAKQRLQELGAKYGFVVSRNPRQVTEDFVYQFANMRIYEGTQEAANARVCTIQTALADCEFAIEQVKRETVLLDSAHENGFMVDVNIQNAIRAILGSEELANTGLLLRGSVLLSLWLGQERRRFSDLDFLATYPPDPERTTIAITSLLTAANLVCNEPRVEAIFEETEFPGLRYHVPVGQDSEQTALQIDVAFNDPLPFGVQLTDFELAGKQAKLPSPAPEVMYAWKLHGLIEFEGLRWRKKDLADLWLLQKHVPLDKHRLKHAVEIAFESRDTPNWRLRRLLDGNIGHSRDSQRQWRKKYRERYDDSVHPKKLPQPCQAQRTIYPYDKHTHYVSRL